MRGAVLAVLVGLMAGAASRTADRPSTARREPTPRLFDQYDNDGYSLEVAAGATGVDGPSCPRVRFPPGERRSVSSARRGSSPPRPPPRTGTRSRAGLRPGSRAAIRGRPPHPARPRLPDRLRSGPAAPAGPGRGLRFGARLLRGFRGARGRSAAAGRDPRADGAGRSANRPRRRRLRGLDRGRLPPLDRGLLSRTAAMSSRIPAPPSTAWTRVTSRFRRRALARPRDLKLTAMSFGGFAGIRTGFNRKKSVRVRALRSLT